MVSNEYTRYPPLTGGSGGVSSLNGQTGSITLVAGSGITITPGSGTLTISSSSGSGTVTSFSFVNGNGFTGTVANPTTTPALTLVGTLTGDITGTLTSTALTATTNSTLTTLSALSLPFSQVTGFSRSISFRTVTTSGSVNSSDNGGVIFCNSSGPITLTMPAHSSGFNVFIKDISGAAQTNNITIVRNGGTGTFEGLSVDKILQTNFGVFRVIDDGTNYWLVGA